MKEIKMMPRGRNYVTYYRVSTAQQGRSGLGLDAQRAAVQAHLEARGGTELATFTEIESGKRNDRPQLEAALRRCRQTRATLLVAKLDRLGRNAAFLLALQESRVRFIAADMPDANEAMVGFMAVMAQYERQAISDRTRAALAAAKARGTRLGNPRLKPGTATSAATATAANAAAAGARARDLADVVADARAAGKRSLREIAAHFNALSIPTPRGKQWTADGIRRLLRALS
jgi:DNA invertase Pin-like site-specific DNA recombinase